MSVDDRVVYWKRRARDAEQAHRYVADEMESQRQWFVDRISEERRLYDRVTHLYGMLRAQGLTAEQIDGLPPWRLPHVLATLEGQASA